MVFQEHQQRLQLQHQSEQKQEQQLQHNEIQRIQLQQQHHRQQQQHLLHQHQQQQRQSQINSNRTNEFHGPGPGQFKDYIDQNHFHQRQQEHQQLHIKLHLQQGEHAQQHTHLQSFHMQRALPSHTQRQHHVVTQAGYGSMADTLRQRQQHLLASAASCNPTLWGVPPPGAASRQLHHLERKLTSRHDSSTTNRKRVIAAVSGNIARPNSSKQSKRSEKKREQEKQRRSDLNEKFASLIRVVKRIENEDEEIDRKRTKMEDDRRRKKIEQKVEKNEDESKHESAKTEFKAEKVGFAGSNDGPADGSTFFIENSRKIMKIDETPKSVSAAIEMISAERRDFKRRFPCFISPSNRSDLISRAVSHLVKYSKVRNILNNNLESLREQVEGIKWKNLESKRKLRQLENISASNVSKNSVTTTARAVNDSKVSCSFPKRNATDKTSNKSSMPGNKDETMQSRTQQSQHQLTQMVMMMPMLMNSDGSFDQPCPQQFMPIPMASMGTHLFNNMMMMMHQPPHVATLPITEQQTKHSDVQNQEQDATPRENSPDCEGEALKSEISVEHSSVDSKLGANSSNLTSALRGTTQGDNVEYTTPCVDSKIDIVKSSGLLEDKTQEINGIELSIGKISPELVFTNLAKDKLSDFESPLQPQETNQEAEPSDHKASELSKSYLNCAEVKQGSSCETTLQVLSSSLSLIKSVGSDSPESPATNIPNSEQKLFPSPATPSPDTVSMQPTFSGKDFKQSIATTEEPKSDTRIKEKDVANKEGCVESHRLSQATQALASTLLGLSKSV